MRGPVSAAERTANPASTGKVAPISMVGTSSSRQASAK